MNQSLQGEKLAVLVANGFCEKDFTGLQRKLQSLGVTMRIVSLENSLVNSWDGTGWGLNFAADKMLSSALAADFSMLVVPGGQRSIEKLKLTAHTKRFINGFLDAHKPVVMCGEAEELLEFCEKSADSCDMLLTGSGEDFADRAVEFLASRYTLVEAA